MKNEKEAKSHIVLIIVIGLVLIIGTYLLFHFVINKEDSNNHQNEEESPIVEKISFDKNLYICQEGSSIEANLKFSERDRVEEYLSSDSSIATIEKHPTKHLKCVGCEVAQINCKQKGITKLSVKSSNGDVATIDVEILERDLTSITFEKEVYSCNVGDDIKTVVRVVGSDGPNGFYYSDGVNSFENSDDEIVTITKSMDEVEDCSECAYALITCKEKGEATLTAISDYGVTMSVPIKVN